MAWHKSLRPARRRAAALVLGLVLAAGLPGGASAEQQYMEVGVPAAVLFDAPSDKGIKRFIVVEATPLEVLSALPPWTKVRDLDGSVSWIRTSELRAARHVQATTLATAHAAPSDASPVQFRLARGVLAERLAPADKGWVEVRHQGTTAYIRVTEIWGL